MLNYGSVEVPLVLKKKINFIAYVRDIYLALRTYVIFISYVRDTITYVREIIMHVRNTIMQTLLVLVRDNTIVLLQHANFIILYNK